MNALRRLWAVFVAAPLLEQLAVAAAGLVLILAISGSVTAAWSAHKDHVFDEREQKGAAEREKLEGERDAALTRAEAAEAQAAVYQAQVDELRKVASSRALTVKEKDREVQAIEDQTNATIADIGTHPLAPDDAAADLRDRLARLRRDHP